MIKYQKLPENILTLLPGAIEYLESNSEVLFAYLFGSLAKAKPKPLSDVDIAVYLNSGSHIVESKLAILGKLFDILQTDEIDLVVLNNAELPLVINILKNKKLIVDKSQFCRHIFESLMMRKYFDFSVFESAQLKRRYLNG
jgi:predicted nucleotidyltransferase